MNGLILERRLLFTTKFAAALVGAIAGCVFVATEAAATPAHVPEIQVIDSVTHSVEESWLAFDEDYVGGLSIAAGDINADNKREIIVVQSGGDEARGIVKIFRTDGTLIAEYPLFAQDVIGAEVDVAVGNVDRDASDEIVVSLNTRERSMVYIFDEKMRFDQNTVGAFEAFTKLKTGVSVAVGNVVGDEQEEIIVGSGPGVSSRVGIFNAQGTSVAQEIKPFDATDTQGVTVAAVEHTSGYDDVAIGLQSGNTLVKQYRIDAAQTYPIVHEGAAWSREFKSGVSLASWDANSDGEDEIVVAPAGDQYAEMRVIDHEGKSQLPSPLFVYEDDFRGGVDVAIAQLDRDAAEEFVVAPRLQKKRGDTARPSKYIEIDLSEQIEYVWEDTYLRNVYLISSGLAGTPSPEGEWSVLKKIANHVYDGRPYYFFPNTPWNLMYKAGGPESNYYLHTAYWHNNFGRPQSHGCINMREADAKFIYFWADIGTPVWIHQ